MTSPPGAPIGRQVYRHLAEMDQGLARDCRVKSFRAHCLDPLVLPSTSTRMLTAALGIHRARPFPEEQAATTELMQHSVPRQAHSSIY